MIFGLILLNGLNIIIGQEIKGQRFKKSNLSCYSVLEENHNFKTKIECFGFCMTQELCKGVLFDGKICKTIEYPIVSRLGPTEGWVLKELELTSKPSK